jgi:hypothetical protein
MQDQLETILMEDEYVLVKKDPPFPQKYIARGTRTVNNEVTEVYLSYTEEGGGWHQWGYSKRDAKLFSTEKSALMAARYAPGPTFYMPAKDSIRTEVVDSPMAATYRRMIEAGMKKDSP